MISLPCGSEHPPRDDAKSLKGEIGIKHVNIRDPFRCKLSASSGGNNFRFPPRFGKYFPEYPLHHTTVSENHPGSHCLNGCPPNRRAWLGNLDSRKLRGAIR